jgi:hypothetical protein
MVSTSYEYDVGTCPFEDPARLGPVKYTMSDAPFFDSITAPFYPSVHPCARTQKRSPADGATRRPGAEVPAAVA